MNNIPDHLLPLVLFVGVTLAGVVGGVLAVAVDRLLVRWGRRAAARLAGLESLVTRPGCDDCSVEPGERHRYAGCPGNVRQHERELAGGVTRA